MNAYAAYTDDALLALLTQSVTPAFDEIYHRYWKRLYRAAFYRLGDAAICEELIQDVFTSLWSHRRTAIIHHLPSYLFTAVKYKVINHIHREMVRKNHQTIAPHTDIDNTTEAVILQHDLNEALCREVNKLPAKRQRIYKLSRESNLSIKQVAARLGISEKTVENQLSAALKTIRFSLRHFINLLFIPVFFLP